MRTDGLYDILLGPVKTAVAGKALNVPVLRGQQDQISGGEDLRASILHNLRMIFQTRRGSVVHLPDFGVPEIVPLFFGTAEAFESLGAQIRETILRYEPRLSKVEIKPGTFTSATLRGSIYITAQIGDLGEGKEEYLTEFSSSRLPTVTPSRGHE